MQKFACRDCPARCCRMPWRITVSGAEKDRILALDWVRERLALPDSRPDFEKMPGDQFSLPMVEKNRVLQCAFLDADNLCSIHKREGIDATPQTCQTFPFGFIELEDGRLQAYLSHLCPSIRDNYGEPLAPQLPEKAERMKGLAPFRLVPRLQLGLGHILQKDYLAWADRAAGLFDGSSHPAAALARIQDWTAQLTSDLPPGGVFQGGLEGTEIPGEAEIPTAVPETWAKSTRLLLATCFLPVSYPNRVTPGRSALERARHHPATFNFVRRLVNQKGEVDLLYLDKPVELAAAFSIPTAISRPECRARLGRFLGGLLLRRNFFFSEKSLEKIIFLLALAGSVVSVFARLKAASEGRSTCGAADIAEGESVAEFVLTYHGNLVQSQKALELLTGFMASYPPAFRGLLETY